MKVGFELYWQRSDAAAVATHVARRLYDHGYDVEFLPRDRPGTVHPAWDRHVHRGRLSYWDWVKKGKFSHVVFGAPPRVEQVQAARAEGARVYVLCLWDELEEGDVPGLHAADKVVCPARNVQALLQEKLELANAVFVPWDAGVPLTHDDRAVDPARVGVYWPVGDSQRFRQDPEAAAGAFHRVLEACPHVSLTVGVGGDLPAAPAKSLRRLQAAWDGRVELVKGPSWEKEQLLYGRHDLTAWPSCCEAVGLVGLTSLAMGTPVVAFDHPLVGEIVKDGRSGLLVPCELSYNWLSVPRAEPDYAAFAAALADLAGSPARLDRLRETTPHGLAHRREAHLAALDDLFAAVL